MNTIVVSPPYPLNAFPQSVRDAVYELLRNLQTPEALAAIAMITTMSVACQPLIDVRLPTGQIRPVVVNSLGVGESGERKSTLDNLTSAPIYDFDEERSRKYEAALTDYRTEQRRWRAIDAGIRSQIKRQTQSVESTEEAEHQLFEHAAKEPVRPRLRRIMRQNATTKAIIDALKGDGESIAFMCDEGEVILKGGPMSQTGVLNKCWDGARSLSFDRSDSESIIVRNPRVTVAFMVQPAVLDAYLERRGDMARGSGHWARYLFAWPASTQGTRFQPDIDPVWIQLPKFHDHVNVFLAEYARRVDANVVERTVLEFCAEAKVRWRDAANSIEAHLRPCAFLEDIKDFSSKVMEIVARLAALFHSFTVPPEQIVVGEGREISLATLESAIMLAEWHLLEFKRLFSPQMSISQAQADAQWLEQHLHERVWRNGWSSVRKNAVLQFGPLRSKKRLDAALEILAALNRVWIGVGLKREKYVNLNTQYFGGMGQLPR
ncbi:YfjI family protein [Paraburkholderia sp.]|uniref:YfjI family protein n=1 Tax=Paraburkholderia sp. TaxID=1926495 RepID=UPI003C7AF7D3